MKRKKIEKKKTGDVRFRKRKCFCCVNRVTVIDYKDADFLKKFINDRGKIIPRRTTGSCAKHQRQIVNSIKKARTIALLPYVA